MKTTLVLSTFAFLFIIGFNSSKEISESTSTENTAEKQSFEPIVEKYWKLIKLNGQEVNMAENQESEMYFMLKTTDNRVTGFAGCNGLGGSYELEEGNKIRFSQMMTTLKACIDPTIRESEFMEVFKMADNYTIVDDTLSLNLGKRAPLAVFETMYF